MHIPEKFVDEKLGISWQVDETPESFARLLRHLDIETGTMPDFEDAVRRLKLDDKRDVTVADIGAGTCWASSIIARHHNVRLVYAVDPSVNRLKHAKFMLKHFGVEEKVRLVCGTFLQPNVPEKVDYVVLCSSFHHCYDSDMPGLFLSIKKMLKPDGALLITNEHYVDWLWFTKRILSYVKHYKNRGSLYYYPFRNIQRPDPFGGNHWRTKQEILNIFKANGFVADIQLHKNNSERRSITFLGEIGWHCYNAILRLDYDNRTTA